MTSKTRALKRSDTRQTRAEDDFDQALVERDPLGRFTGRGGPGRKEKPETKILRRIRERLPEGAEKALEVLIEQLTDTDKRIRQGAAKILLERVAPVQIMERAWISVNQEDEKKNSLASVLPQIREFLIWRMNRVLEPADALPEREDYGDNSSAHNLL